MNAADVIAGRAQWVVLAAKCEDILPALPPACVSACATDPPYGTEDLGGGYGRRQLADPAGRTGHVILDDHDLSAWERCVAQLPRILRAPAWSIFFCAARRRHETESLSIAAGFTPVGEFVWSKPPGLGYTIRYAHETAIVHSLGAAKANECALSVLYGDRSERAMALRHPHEKPVSTMADIIRFACAEGDVVLDPFCGSGSTGCAAVRLGRRFIGIERSEQWAEVARERITAECAGSTLQARRAGQVPLFPTGTP